MPFEGVTLKPLPPKKALEFWKSKVPMPYADFKALDAKYRMMAFSAAGLHNLRAVNTVKIALQDALEKGLTLKEFEKRVKNIFRGYGRWHIDNVFRTNIQTAYSVGAYMEAMENVGTHPYWMYVAVNDSRTRPTHRALHGKVFRHDSSFWDKWMPPNGYRCRCRIRTLTEAQIKKKGIKVEDRDPTGELIEPIDPITGKRLPARPLMPDPGFAHNPGKTFYRPDLSGVAEDLKGIYIKEKLKKTTEYARKTVLLKTKNQREMIVAIDQAGNIVAERLGERSFVDLSDLSERLFRAKALIHNHPGGSSFSMDDLCLAAKLEIETIEAVTDEFVYRFTFMEKVDPSTVFDLYLNIEKKVRREFLQKIGAGELTIEQANRLHHHEIAKRLAPQIGAKYERISLD